MTFAPADVQRMIDNAVVNCPGVTLGAVYLELFNVLSDFFQNSNIWVEDIQVPVTPTNVRGTCVEIEPEQGQINRLMYVINASNISRAMTMRVPGELMFIDVPSGDEVWTARVALTVSDPVPQSGRQQGIPIAPAWVLSKYNNGITDGLIGSLMAQVAKPYSNPRMAAQRMRKYATALGNARSEARHQNLFGGQTWRFPQGFVGTSSQNRRGI